MWKDEIEKISINKKDKKTQQTWASSSNLVSWIMQMR